MNGINKFQFHEVQWILAILLDIRDWSPGHEKMGKGISLNADEIEN